MLADRIHSFIATGGVDGDFDTLALEAFAYQYDAHDLYGRFCESRGANPRSVAHWREIPAIPTDAFKHALTDEADRPHLFLSTGTTAGERQRSRHALRSLDTYRVSAMTHFERMVLPDGPGPMATLLIGPSASNEHSSLGRMFSWCLESFASDDVAVAFDADGNLDVAGAVTWLEEKAAGSAPVLLLGVTSAFTALFDALRVADRGLRLPADSRIVDTGGRKSGQGRTPGDDNEGDRQAVRALSARGMLKAGWRFLHVPAYLSVNEYGMTEMLSQFYDDAWLGRCSGRLSPRSKVGPPWVRTTVVDPLSLEPAAPGQAGLLAHVDLANWETVSALQTLDLGRELGAGFELLGRASGAEARGCSQLLATVAAHDEPRERGNTA